MIEINLIEQKKHFKLPTVLGIDFAELNIKYLVVAVIIMYLPDLFLPDFYAEQLSVVNNNLNNINQKISKINKEIRSNDDVKKKLESFNQQVEKLKKRSQQVDQIIKTRTNPKKILERLARDIPEDVWLDRIEIKQDKSIIIEGGATSYKSIGNFISLANESTFFGKSLTLAKSSTKKLDETKTKEKTNDQARIEAFTIEGKIETYDPDIR